jgi:hypothetical protein
MTTTREDFTTEMAGMVSNLAFQLCLVPEDETVKAIKELHAGFVERYQELFSDSAEEGNKLTIDVLNLVVRQRHELERYGSVVSRAIH